MDDDNPLIYINLLSNNEEDVDADPGLPPALRHPIPQSSIPLAQLKSRLWMSTTSW
jgi:hypothetical protein